jgi:hypothetical protein
VKEMRSRAAGNTSSRVGLRLVTTELALLIRTQILSGDEGWREEIN